MKWSQKAQGCASVSGDRAVGPRVELGSEWNESFRDGGHSRWEGELGSPFLGTGAV